jgi:hypothetical protein
MLALDLRKVGADVRGIQARTPVPKRPRIVPPQNVVGDTEDVEARRSVGSTTAPSESSPSLQLVWE